MEIENRNGGDVSLEADAGAIFEDTFLSVWRGETDNDPFNQLVLATGLTHRQVSVLRAIGRYLKQGQTSIAQAYMAATLARHPKITTLLHSLFDTLFNPTHHGGGDEDPNVLAKHMTAQIRDMLAEVENIDEDMVLRRYLTVIEAMLRTNYYAPETDGEERRTLAFKFDPKAMDFLPAPRPYREVFVYGTEVEGVHLRFGPVARGGLRWSDRAEDYRTEVLGLVKAQQVKNAVIVPVGAKGGFLPKMLPIGGDRQAVYEAGRAAYVTFITALLSLTDNIVDNDVVQPQNIICRDGEDPYLVVAADKGTATFSDTANGISQDHDFWLDDAFASGGSAGYDHKAMGITARGAWEAVKRHFREMDKNIQEEPFTVIGIGDMSGDVFGNGMLLSEHIRLIAAFDHRDIFIDPDPDVATSFAERKRVFDMGRSTWQNYDKKKLSKGGGIFPRSQKSITLSRAAADAIGLERTKASPNEIMRAILMADAELLWFGGIGTYVRASSESDAEAGDRTNDAIRITARELRAKVVGEGANLGMTQRARIEYGLNGGRCNSDAIDNSAGVNSSDLEVNIKVALAPAMRAGDLTRNDRNKLLVSMTESVADLCLDNNYEQTLTLSRIQRAGMVNLSLQAQLMKTLEERGQLDRAVENLPDEDVIAERAASRQGLTRAEGGVLLSYAKIVLFDELVNSDLPDDPYLERDLLAYFPARMQKAHGDLIRDHRLRSEIIATQLANNVVNRGGPSVISRFEDATGALPSHVVHAHVVTRDAYKLEAIHDAINALDNQIGGDEQMRLHEDLADAQRIAISRYLKSGRTGAPLAECVEALATAYGEVRDCAPAMLPEYLESWTAERRDRYVGLGLSSAAATGLAYLPVLATAPEILAVADQAACSVRDAASAYYAVTKAFRLGRLENLAHQIDVSDYFDGLAQARALDTIDRAHAAITLAALKDAPDDMGDMRDVVQRWIGIHRARIAAVQSRINAITDSTELTVSRLTVAAGLLSDIAT
jgi:glutamate dehydrogenase